MNEEFVVDAECLQDYLDGRLTQSEGAAVAAHLEANPAQAAELQQMRQLQSLLAGVNAEVLEDPVPARLLRTVRQGKASHQLLETKRITDAMHEASSAEMRVARLRSRRRFAVAAVAAGLFLGGAGLGWHSHQYSNPSPSVADLALSDAARAYFLYGGEQSFPVEFGPERLAELTDWVGRTFQRTIDPPDLSVLGYHFVGGRLLPGFTGISCMYLFQNAGGQRTALLFWERDAVGAPMDPRRGTLAGLQSRYWSSEGLVFALLSDEGLVGLDELTALVQDAYADPQSPQIPGTPQTPAPAKQALLTPGNMTATI